jgi:hypothetical protein
MFKTVAAGAAALVIASGAAAYAQVGASASPQGGHGNFAPEDRAAFLSARVAALHAGLQLTPEQEKAWPAFERAYRELAEHHRRPSGHNADESLDPVQRAQRRADALAARSTDLKQYADALAPLYQGLDDGQKRRFAILVHIGHHPHFHHFGLGRDRKRNFGEREGSLGPHGELRRGELGLQR